jgi:hypothetical protein
MVESPPSQQDPYLSPHKDVEIIACLVQELLSFKVVLPNPDAATGVRSPLTLM